ncbi:MAG TPA: proteasome activator [Acidimicrobiales bacterium]|nr:proteasome activator [Acidimicrobiales bacterium]
MSDQGPLREGDDGAQYLVIPGPPGGAPGEATPGGETEAMSAEAVQRPAKVMRIGSMIKQLLEEVRGVELDSAARIRLREIYESSVRELADTLSPDLAAELDRMTLSFDSEEPSDAELRVAQAQLVGWLEGLFHGIQATLFAQQMAAQAQLEDMRRRSLPAGAREAGGSPPGGQYL